MNKDFEKDLPEGYTICSECNGTGYVDSSYVDEYGDVKPIQIECEGCDGKGYREE